MNGVSRSRWLRPRLGWGILLLLAILAGAYFRPWAWREYVAYYAMSRECHPVWSDLYWGRIQAGDDVESVILRTQPPVVERFGNYVALSYEDPKAGLHFTGLRILARDGKLVGAAAWSCTWSRTFFDRFTEEDRRACDAAYRARLEQ